MHLYGSGEDRSQRASRLDAVSARLSESSKISVVWVGEASD